MKIVYVANVRLPTEKAHGGAIVKACQAFVRSGADVDLLVACRRNAFAGDPRAHYGIQEPLRVRYLPSVDWIGSGSRAAFLLQSLTFYLSVCATMLFGSRTRIIYTRDAPVCLLALLGYRVVFECHMLPERVRIFFAMVRWAYRVVVISRSLKDALTSHVDRKAILIAPSGVDLSIFDVDVSKEEARRQLNLPMDATIAVYSGNFTTMRNDKGISDILQALAKAPRITFVAVGGSADDIARYEAEARHHGVSSRVILRGHMPQRMLALYQKAADMLLMPFPDILHYRSYMSPIKMFEYMASKRPIIASDLPTIREILGEKTAVLVPPGGAPDIARAMVDIAAHPSRGLELADAAFMEVAQQYTWDTRAKRLLAFIAADMPE